MEEIWKTLKYHDQVYNRYEVSTFGNIRHKINKINRKFYLDKKGYCRTSIFNGYVNNKRKIKNIIVHIAVASTFIDNPEKKSTVNHIDGDKANNHVENLEWATVYEQIQHASFVLGYSKLYSDTMRKTFSKKTAQYNKKNELVKIWNSTREIERSLGFRHENVAACARGSRKTAYGYRWQYVKEA